MQEFCCVQVVSLGASWGGLKSISLARKFNVCDSDMYVGFISLLSYHVQILHPQECIFKSFCSAQHFCVNTNAQKCADWSNYQVFIIVVVIHRVFTVCLWVVGVLCFVFFKNSWSMWFCLDEVESHVRSEKSQLWWWWDPRPQAVLPMRSNQGQEITTRLWSFSQFEQPAQGVSHLASGHAGV